MIGREVGVGVEVEVGVDCIRHAIDTAYQIRLA